MKTHFRITLLTLALLLASASSSRAFAMGSDIRSMLVGGLYGAAGGTVLGLVTVPFTKDVRTMFMGTSIGLYLGLIAGFYYVKNRDDPGNPLRRQPRYIPQGNVIPKWEEVHRPVRVAQHARQPAQLQMDFSLLKF